ncbi:MAG: CopG family transcriptional regulator [Clostridia bacterium]|nr:CopG family transcriptional regulator [Clostridia bacterium]
MKEIKSEPLKIKRRGEDGTRVISVRVREETLSSLDSIANEIHYSRNELINIILEHGINNLEIE